MAGREEKVSVELDAEMVERARVQLGLDRTSDATVVERALNAYLLMGVGGPAAGRLNGRRPAD
jgi:hypothetical protein